MQAILTTPWAREGTRWKKTAVKDSDSEPQGQGDACY